MKKKIVGILVCMLMVLPVLTMTVAAEKTQRIIVVGKITDLVVEEDAVSWTNIRVRSRFTEFNDGTRTIGIAWAYDGTSEFSTDEYKIRGIIRPNFICLILTTL